MSIRNLLPARNRRLVPTAVVVLLLAGGTVLAWRISEHQEDKFHPHEVRLGLLYRSRQLEESHFPPLKRRNITQVVNLRSESEDPNAYAMEANACQALGMRMVHIPVTTIVPNDDQVRQFLRAVNDNKGATLVHCAQGRTRTGFMVAAFRVILDSWSPQRAYDELIQRGFHPAGAKEINDSIAFLERLDRQRTEWLEQINIKTTQP